MQTELPSSAPALQDHQPSPVPKAQGFYKPGLAQGQQQQHQGPAANPRSPSSGRIPDNGIVQPWQHLGTDIPRLFVRQSQAPGDATHHSSHPPGCPEGWEGAKQGNKEPYAKPARAICSHWNTFTSEIEGIVCCSKVLITQPWESKALMCLEGIKHPVKIEFPSVFRCLSIRHRG